MRKIAKKGNLQLDDSGQGGQGVPVIRSFGDKQTEPLRPMKTKADSIPLLNYFAETLRETLDEWHESQIVIATATGIPPSHLSQMKMGRRRCTPEYDLRLSRYFGIEAGYWLRLQLAYELQRAERENRQAITRIRPASNPAA
jgi:addiction module HigA family antidote